MSNPNVFPKIMCFLGALFYAYEFFLRVTPSVTVQELSTLYHINTGAVGALSASYFYAYTPMQLVVGTLMDHYGVRKLLTMACAACVAGTMLFMTGWQLSVAHIGRFAIGFGSAFAFVGVLKIASDWLPTRYFALISGLTTTLGMLGAIGGEVAIAGLKHTFGYHETMMVSAGFGALLTVLLWLILRDHQTTHIHKKQEIKLKSLFNDLRSIGTIPQIWINAIVGAALFTPTTIFAGLWAVPYLTTIKHMPETTAAIASSAIFLGWAIGGPIMGYWSDAIQKRKRPLYLGSAACTILSLILIYTPIAEPWIIIAIMLGIGIFSSAEILVFAISHDICAHHLAGTGIALTNMLLMMGGFLQPLVGWLLVATKHLTPDMQYQIALSIVPLCFAIALVALPFLKETHCNSQETSNL